LRLGRFGDPRGEGSARPHETPQKPPPEGRIAMPKLKTHKGMKKRFKVSATGKVSHKRCGSSHLNSHKSGKKIRRLRKKSWLTNSAEAHRVRRAVKRRQSTQPD